MGGAAGHMRHPFDLVGDIKTGGDLIEFFNNVTESITNKNPCVKIDGTNVSFKLIDGPDGKEFAVDRSSMGEIDISGITIDRVNERFPSGHGMRAAITLLLDIFNEALPKIKKELKQLDMWNDPTKFFNTEYVMGTTNVTEYDENFIAIHSINQFYERTAKSGPNKGAKRPGAPRPLDDFGKSIDDPSREVEYDDKILEQLVKKVSPIAKEYGFQIYTCIPTYFMDNKIPNFDSVLNSNFSIVYDENEPPLDGPLGGWLQKAKNRKFETITMIRKGEPKVVPAMLKDIYLNVYRDRIPITKLIPNGDDVKKAIDSAVFWHAMRLLGHEVLKSMDSPMGRLAEEDIEESKHEGIVIRDSELSPYPIKITGEFIVKGLQSTIMSEPLPKEPDVIKDPTVSGDKVALVPGKFKPPHRGHLDMVKHYASIADVVKVMISPIPKDEISWEDSKAIWEVYLQNADEDLSNVVIMRSPQNSPVGASFDYVENKNKNPDLGQPGELVILGASTKGGDQSRFAGNVEKYAQNGIKVLDPMKYAFRPMPPELHAGDFRAAIAAKQDISQWVPEESLGSIPQIMNILGVKEEETEKKSLDQDSLFSLVEDVIEEEEEELEEMSSMAAGHVEGTASRDETEVETLIREIRQKERFEMTDRKDFMQEIRLRRLIRKGIGIVQERKRKERKKTLLEEQKLRKLIRTLIKETATPDNDPAPHRSTGINVLEDLLKKIIPVLETDYKKLTTDRKQRDSFRAHVVKAVEDILVPPKVTDQAGSQGGDEPQGEMIPVIEAEGDDIDITVGKPEDDDAFIDIDPAASKEEEDEPEEPDERDVFGIPDQEETGRNVAFESFKKVQAAVVDSWDVLSGEEDKELFYDYLITNLKLYFDKFENDMIAVEEPTTDEYEQQKQSETGTPEEAAPAPGL